MIAGGGQTWSYEEQKRLLAIRAEENITQLLEKSHTIFSKRMKHNGFNQSVALTLTSCVNNILKRRWKTNRGHVNISQAMLSCVKLVRSPHCNTSFWNDANVLLTSAALHPDGDEQEVMWAALEALRAFWFYLSNLRTSNGTEFYVFVNRTEGEKWTYVSNLHLVPTKEANY